MISKIKNSQTVPYIRPNYYKVCGLEGKVIFERAYFPYPEALTEEPYPCELGEIYNNPMRITSLYFNDNMYMGTCLKYLWRLGCKLNWYERCIPRFYRANVLRDLIKAQFYIDVYVQQCESLGLVEDKDMYFHDMQFPYRLQASIFRRISELKANR